MNHNNGWANWETYTVAHNLLTNRTHHNYLKEVANKIKNDQKNYSVTLPLQMEIIKYVESNIKVLEDYTGKRNNIKEVHWLEIAQRYYLEVS